MLSYAGNNCYVSVSSKIPEEIEVNIPEKTWSYKDRQQNNSKRRSYKIGRETRQAEHGAIGIFDKTDSRQLDAMVHAATEAVRDRHAGDY